MVTIPVRKFFPSDLIPAAGAALGSEHFEGICQKIPSAKLSSAFETIVALDFDGIEDATPSYIKATVLALHQCGRLYAEELTHSEAVELENQVHSLNIVVCLLNASEPVQLCVHEVFSLRGLGILNGVSISDDRLERAVLLGRLDSKVEHTLLVTAPLPNFSAPELAVHVVSEQLSVNGWNNRLAELHRHRLIRRRAEGRTLRFFPVANEIFAYGKVLFR